MAAGMQAELADQMDEAAWVVGTATAARAAAAMDVAAAAGAAARVATAAAAAATAGRTCRCTRGTMSTRQSYHCHNGVVGRCYRS